MVSGISTGGINLERREPGIVRRQFLKRALALAAAGPIVGLLASCGSAATTTTTAATSAAATSAAATSAAATSAAATSAAATSSAATTAAAATSSAATASAAATTSAAATSSAAAAGARGKSGALKMLFWQAVTILNPHLATGTKDQNASRLVLEPLFTAKIDGTVLPVLAAEVPSVANGGLASDGKSVTIKLRQDVKWSDGQPFTADDVVFTWQYVTNKATAATSLGSFLPISKVEAVDPHTAKISFTDPNPAWFAAYLGANVVLPQHVLKDAVGAAASSAPFNKAPIGTGPYKVDSFTPGDIVTYSINDGYRDPNKPAFATVQIKGGGDATSAARAVFQTGEYDYAWNLQVEWPVLQDIMKGGKGDLVTAPGGGCEMLFFNLSDPNKDVNGEKSSITAPHPILSDIKVRQAINMAIDRDTMAKQLYGETGDPTVDVITVPTSVKSTGVSIPFDIAGANKLLDDAGWAKGSDGIRAKNGIPIKLTYQTSINSLRQKEQAIVKQGCQQIGIELTIKTVDAGVFFSSGANPDTIAHFYADMQTFTSTVPNPAPVSYMRRWTSITDKDIAQKSNEWSGANYSRWKNDQVNQLYTQATTEIDPAKFDALMKQINDLVVSNYVTTGLIDRKAVDCKAKSLDGPDLNSFDQDTWNIADWTRKA